VRVALTFAPLQIIAYGDERLRYAAQLLTDYPAVTKQMRHHQALSVRPATL
jgi:hypothetical protein